MCIIRSLVQELYEDYSHGYQARAQRTPLSSGLDKYNYMRYIVIVIKGFYDKESEKLYLIGKSRKLPQNIISTALRKLEQLNAASQIEDLRIFPGNRLEQLKGKMKGKCSIRINDQWRIVFSFSNGNAYDVEITDYHK